MLKNKLILFTFFRFIQSGFYLDFIFKKLSEMFMRNIFIYSSIFFGEKYMIEFITKKTIDSFIFNNNKQQFNLNESKYFIQILTIILYLIFITIFILLYI
jgi:hypothetical protein